MLFLRGTRCHGGIAASMLIKTDGGDYMSPADWRGGGDVINLTGTTGHTVFIKKIHLNLCFITSKRG